ncbi:hypothetical protein [Shewanella sp. KJ2020]|uniref:hypothetical protein n=1 Tax=Shewanella sp. KJ2020 TaxID=2919172 RepID=UPI0020A7767E|nr:hypothetical protein [Shewanella sp. KJ2020]MCP3130007.1 hypothetical protein [Shewanella sp. KJ2020]
MLVCVAIMLIAHSASYTPKTSAQRSEFILQHVQLHSIQKDRLQMDTGDLDNSSSTTTSNAAPQSWPNADAIAQSNAQTVESCGSLNTDAANAANAAIADSESQPTPCPSSDYVSHSDELNFAPINSPRFLSLAQHDVREVKPEYLLALDFTVESPPNIVESPKLDIASDWTLSAVSSPARISGWKVSNLQYRFSQQAA